MKIAVDFDDTIVDTVPEVLARLNKMQRWTTTGSIHDWSPADITEWDMSKITGFTHETILEEWGKVDYFKNVNRELEAVSTIRRWKDEYGYDVEIVTANPNKQVIREWLDFNGLSDIHLTSTPSKVSHLIDEGFDIMVDDSPKVALSAAGNGISTLLYHKPWNASIDQHSWDLLYRCFGWYEVDKAVRRLAQAEMVGKMQEVITKVESSPSVTNFERALRDAGFSNVVLTPEAKKYYAEVLDDDLLEGQEYTGPMGTTTMPEEFGDDYQCIGGGILENSEGERTYDEDIETNEHGAKQTRIYGRFDLLPMRALWSVARVLQDGADKYGIDNWRGLSVDEINNHVWAHLADYQLTGNLEDLEHAAVRVLMALEIARGGGNV